MPNPFHADHRQALSGIERWLPWLLFGAAFVVLFFNLGSGALFEPDEGRNAEKARQILVLNDWITPHENFYSVIDNRYSSIGSSGKMAGDQRTCVAYR